MIKVSTHKLPLSMQQTLRVFARSAGVSVTYTSLPPHRASILGPERFTVGTSYGVPGSVRIRYNFGHECRRLRPTTVKIQNLHEEFDKLKKSF